MNQLRNLIEEQIALPHLARNPRGKVRLALTLLPEHMQKVHACDLAEHGIKQLCLTEDERVESAIVALHAIRRFLNANEDIDNVHLLSVHACDIDTLETQCSSGYALSLGNIGRIVRLTSLCCCQRELEKSKLNYPTSYQPDAFAVAEAIYRAIALNTGGEHWDSKNSARRQSARKRGTDASHQEAEWQLSHILSTLS